MKRNFGLDIIRALAISLVLVDHGWYFNPALNPNSSNLFSAGGFGGVELFFVLSGFLIGRIAFKNLVGGNIRKLPNFYLRRWFRTLPLYYLLLTVFIVVSNLFYHEHAFHPLHYVFLQNFIPVESNFFSIAWSLSVEEWFYLLLPLYLLLASLKAKTGKGLIKAVLISIIVVFAIRVGYVATHSIGFTDVRKSIPLRFDSLMTGVLLAGIKMYYTQLYAFLQKSKAFFASFAAFILLMVYFSYLNPTGAIDQSFLFKTIGILLVSMSVAGMIPFVEASRKVNVDFAKKKLVYQAITGLSIISYSLYLIHLEINTVFIKYLSSHINPILLFAITTTVAIGFSILLYNIIEKPVMSLRDKITLHSGFNLFNLKNRFLSLKSS